MAAVFLELRHTPPRTTTTTPVHRDVTRMTMPSHLHLTVSLQCDVLHGDTFYCHVSWFILVLICLNVSVSKYLATPPLLRPLRLCENINKVVDAKHISFDCFLSACEFIQSLVFYGTKWDKEKVCPSSIT